ncbi:virginiamycin B lyase family protein [Corallococcus silvisoli]|uniref:virginiamycin B lyase family protein n=1 Tax=Corallococcus silvisoli TaxID=2697031 RepID=UPI0013789BD6|nr:hypothetical protein [Corallococcus silvisoli]NBD07540.1 hypothetical protein [Corallococcus silvisoli]
MTLGSSSRGLLLLMGLLLAVQARAGQTHVIDLTDAPPYMTPLSLRARVGDTITFKNHGPEMVHSITDDALILFSGDLAVGAEWSYTFKRAGVYPYVCFRHHFMRGAVTVENPDGTTDSPPEFPYHAAFREFVIPTLRAVPRMIIPSRKDDTLWFTEGGGDFYGFENIPANNKLGQVDDQGRIIEFATPTPGSDGSTVGVDSLVMDASGAVWFTERLTNRIGRLDPSGTIREFPLPSPKGYALGIDLDAKGRIWFAERYANRIGFITPDGKVTEVELPGKDSEPRTVYVDRRQRIWYTARTANEIGYYEPARRRFVRLKIPTENARPTGIAETSDGTVWFVEMVGNKLAKVVGDQIIEYALPTRFSAPFKIVADAKDRLWFTEVFGNAIGMMDTRTGKILEYKIPTPDSRPGGITVDRKGRVWFTEQTGNKIGMVVPEELARYPDPVPGPSLGPVQASGREKPWAPSPGGPPAPGDGDGAPRVAPPAGTQGTRGGVPAPGPSPKPEGPQALLGQEDFALPHAGSGPGNELIEDAEGLLWFNQLYGNRIGAFDRRTQRFREYALPSVSSMPSGMAMDRSGQFWIAQFRTNALARLEPRTGHVDEYPLPIDAALPSSVAVDEHDAVWLTLLGANRIARFDRAERRFDLFEMPREGSSPLHLAADRRGGLWISASEEAGNYVARFDTVRHTFEVHAMPTPDSSPIGVLVDDAAVWVAEGGAGKLARLDLGTRRWEEFTVPASDAEPVRLAKDARGRIWLTDGGGLGGVGGNRIAVFDPRTRAFELIPMRIASAKPRGILASADGNIWFTQQNANLLSRIHFRGQ